MSESQDNILLKSREEAAMLTLDDIINSTENLEVKRALAIKMFPSVNFPVMPSW